MTLVCCWIDQSYGKYRISAIADSRATDSVGNTAVIRSDMTIKLLKVPVKCHHIDTFDGITGRWHQPYFESELAVGFAGQCFEALTIIELFSRAMEQLVTMGPQEQPFPEPDRIVSILETIVADYFADHKNKDAQRVSLLLFGFSDKKPWIARVSHDPAQGISSQSDLPMREDRIYTVGDAGGVAFEEGVEEVRVRIRKHAAELKAGPHAEDRFERDLEEARHKDADKKHIEERVMENIEAEYRVTVGGHLQKLEVYPAGPGGVVSYARESRSDVLDRLPAAGTELRYMPVGDQTGRKPR